MKSDCLANASCMAITLTLSMILPISEVYADPQMRIGLSATCPSGAQEPKAESAVAAGAALMAVDLAAKAAGSLIDAIGEYAGQTTALTVQQTEGVDNFLSVGDHDTVVMSQRCIWVAVANNFGGAYRGDISSMISAPPKEAANIQKDTRASSPLLFYFEGYLQPSSDLTAWRLRPSKWHYNHFIGEAANIFQSKGRDFAFTVELSKPGQETPIGIFTFAWNNQEEGQITPESVTLIKPSYVPSPNFGKAPADKNSYYPINLRAQIVETAKPTKLGVFIESTAATNRKAVVDWAKQKGTLAVSASARAEARITAAAATAKGADAAAIAATAYDTAYQAVQSAKSSLDAAIAAKNQADINRWTNTLSLAKATLDARKVQALQAFESIGQTFQATGVPD